ncbi:MAG TPA: TetR/AcrR family transcriptional regulator [Rhodothermales bacterium]|nr:TetR/AcrR family transcriptional regulator [Rhodothermales bacterium]
MSEETGKATEDKIFEAARDVFHEQGYGGARMQEIADRAGINKALLHYYYRSKDKLFEAVFHVSAMRVVPQIVGVLTAEMPLREKIERFVHTYIDQIVANPHVPGFILQELRRNPNRLRQFVGELARDKFAGIAQDIEEAVARGEIRPIEAPHLLANILGLCVFPFIARPMLQTVVGFDDAAYDAFLEARKQEVTAFILNALEP